jgi:membrane-associated phospholipid phosphatase
MSRMLVVFVLGFPTAGHAEPAPYELRNTGGWFLGAEFGAALVLGFVGPDLITKPQPEDLTCADAWCDPGGFDTAVRSLLVADEPRWAGTTSHVFTVGLTPVVAFGGAIVGAASSGRAGPAIQDSVVLLDVFLLSTGVNSVAKVSGKRQRPGFHFGREALTEADGHPREEFVSFYSGDTTWAFALAAGGTTLAYLRGYPHARYVALASGTFALTGGILRITADMHWATDVLAGAVSGVAIGAGVPLLLHGRVPGTTGVSVSPSLTDPGFTIRGRW